MNEMKHGSEMMKGKTTCACGMGCSCGCGHHCMHRAIWWMVAIIILVIVFTIGVRAGEFRDALRRSYGGYYRGYPMMQGYEYNGGGAVPVSTAAGNATGTTGNVPMIPVQ